MRGLSCVLLAGCAAVTAAPAPAPAPTPVVQVPLGAPFAVAGEAMLYEVRFRGLRVGRVQVAVGQPGWRDGRPAIIVKSRGVTDGLIALIGELEWELETTIDLERGTPLATVEHAVVNVRGKRKTSDNTRGVDDVHSIHSAAAVLRGWRSAPAQQARFTVRIDDARFDVAIQEAGHELLASAGKPAVRYAGRARSKFPFELWLSDDAARVPLRLETATKWGAVVVELVEYEAPRD